MRRTSAPFRRQFLTAATTVDDAMYSSRSQFKGSRGQGRRGYCDRVPGDGGDQFVTGDSHFQSVRDANRGYRTRPVERGSFSNAGSYQPQFRAPTLNHIPPTNSPYPPQFNPRQPASNVVPPFNNTQFYRPPLTSFRQNQPFHPPRQQQFRPQPRKPLDYRDWEFARSRPPHDSERFTVLSYNILADYLAINHWRKLYFHIPRHILDWEWRRRNIIWELGLWRADILCFQEVDNFLDLEVPLKQLGYNGIWKMRTGDHVDGCAIFWRLSRFKLLYEDCIAYNKLGLRDNVAQICVLELIKQHDNQCSAPLTESVRGSSRVVICNIHVLYNPKRGDIKLGQVRVLLDRAYAVSKLWDDAPVVVCGDFNCTPKSPLYNFIVEQKLDLSKCFRDKISGQVSAEIRSQSSTNPNFWAQQGYSSVEAPVITNENKLAQANSPVDDPDVSLRKPSSCGISEPQHSISMKQENKVSASSDEYNEAHLDIMDASKDESAPCVSVSGPNDYSVGASKDASAYSVQVGGSNECPLGAHTTVGGSNENPLGVHTTFSTNHSESHSYVKIGSCDGANDRSLHEASNDVNILTESEDMDVLLDEKIQNLTLGEPIKITVEDGTSAEDCNSFLSELHKDDGSFLFKSSHKDYSHVVELESDAVEESTYSQSAWTPMEIETASGDADCSVVEHPLKLCSTYPEVENISETRDTNGEPIATSYHRCFFGTVDYIWRSEGLQTVRVLAPIPRHAMQWTPGFPTKKWGSDHIALASELTFTKGGLESVARNYV